MSTLLVDVPGGAEPRRMDLPDGASVLVGREPDLENLRGLLPDVSAAPSVLTVPAQSVSANHAMVTREGPLVSVRDLGSRNGTWLRVPAHGAARVETDGDVHLRLTGGASVDRSSSEPQDPQYSDREDYGAAMAACVTRWLVARGILARVGVDRGAWPEDWDGVLRFALGSGEFLWIVCDQTLEATALRQLEGLRAWVHRNDQALFAEEETRSEGMILASREIRAAYREVTEAARRRVPSAVFLGPSGAGKERLARAFHQHSGRSGPFVALNCAMLDRGLARVDLFGAEVGAYTGCTRTQIGAVERAHGGTLFLDEIVDMPPDVQGFLLRFLDAGGEFERMGGERRKRHADVRIVCAANRDLREVAQQGGFRKDLWWRLSVAVIEVPPLSRRFDDVLAYLRTQPLGAVTALEALQPAALAFLRRHAWEGNFRELTNFVMRLPPVSAPLELDEPTVRRALLAGALSQPPLSRPAPAEEDPDPPSVAATFWEETARLAAAAYSEDRPGRKPSSLPDTEAFIEQYFKPLALQRMTAALEESHGAPHSRRDLSQLLQADTKTVSKHLKRAAERFGR